MRKYLIAEYSDIAGHKIKAPTKVLAKTMAYFITFDGESESAFAMKCYTAGIKTFADVNGLTVDELVTRAPLKRTVFKGIQAKLKKAGVKLEVVAP